MLLCRKCGSMFLLRCLVPLQEVRMFNSYRTPSLLVFISSNELFGMKTSGWDEDTALTALQMAN